MKIVLIRPYYNCFIFSPALGLGYLASVMKKYGAEVKIIDALCFGLDNAKVIKLIKEESPDLVGISCTSYFYHETIDLSKKLKNEGLKVFIGGLHPSFLPYSTLKDSEADFVMCGEGENASAELVKNNLNYKGIQGLYSIDDLKSDKDEILFAKQEENLDEIPWPDWEQLCLNSLPQAPHGVVAKAFPIATIMTSRGCPYCCTFCASASFYGKRVRFRSVDDILDEAECLKTRFNVKEIQIIDDNLALNKEFLLEFCQKYIDRKIKLPWSCPNGLRADKLDEDICNMLKKAGCYYVAVGIETGDSEILKSIKKSETLEDIERGINCLHKAGIIIQGNFILGHHGETRKSIQNTIDFIFRLPIDRLSVEILELLPGSELWKKLYGSFIPNFTATSAKVPNIENEEISKEELCEILKKINFRFYSRPQKLFQLLRFLKPKQIGYIYKRMRDYGLLNFFSRK